MLGYELQKNILMLHWKMNVRNSYEKWDGKEFILILMLNKRTGWLDPFEKQRCFELIKMQNNQVVYESVSRYIHRSGMMRKSRTKI